MTNPPNDHDGLIPCPFCKGRMVEINTVLGKQIVHASQILRGDSIGLKDESPQECGLSFRGSREDWNRAPKKPNAAQDADLEAIEEALKYYAGKLTDGETATEALAIVQRIKKGGAVDVLA